VAAEGGEVRAEGACSGCASSCERRGRGRGR